TDIDTITQKIGVESAAGVERAHAALQRLGQESATALIITAVLSLGLALLAALMLTRRIVRPLRQLSRAAEEFGQGNLDHQVSVGDAVEFVTLGAAFNHMANELRDLIGSL